jgi:hypothetical protein
VLGQHVYLHDAEQSGEKWKNVHGRHTLELLQNARDGAGAAAAGHGDVELVGVVGHCGEVWLGVVWREIGAGCLR